MAVTFRIRRDTSANWASVNPILALGEPGHETDTLRKKTGDGSTAWNSLLYDVGAFSGILPISQGGTGRTNAKPMLIASRSIASGSFQTVGRAFTIIQINSAPLDTSGGFNTATYLYTAPETGVYIVNGRYRVADPAPAGINCAIGVDVATSESASVIWQTIASVSASTSRHSMQISRIISVTAGQQVRLFAYIDSATAVGISSAELNVVML